MARSLPRVFIFVSASFLLLHVLRSTGEGQHVVPTNVSAHVDKKLEGGELFGSRGCTHCHGADGTGTEEGPSLRDIRKRLKPDQIAEQIRHGGKQMPAFGDSLDEEQIADLVAFLDAKRWEPVPASNR